MRSTVNEISIRAKAINALKKQQFVGLARNAANTRFIANKNEMLKEFDNHIVTRELLDYPSKYGESELISKGNLSTFLGFEDGSIKVGEVREYLSNNNNIYMERDAEIKTDNRKIYYNFAVKTPSIRDIYEDPLFETPDNWSSRSWIEIIENGVGNAAYYIFSLAGFNNSRSFFGLQNKKRNKKNPASFKPMKYITEILQNFRDRF